VLTDQQVQTVHEDGFVKVTGLYTETEMGEMEDAFESCIKGRLISLTENGREISRSPKV